MPSMAVSTNSFPIYERLCGFQTSAFQPYIRTNTELFGTNEVCQQQIISPTPDANLVNYCDTFKTFTELKSMPMQTQTNVTDLARLTLHEPLPLRVLPNTFFQPFAAPTPLYTQCDQTNIATPVTNVNISGISHQQLTPKRQILIPSKEENSSKTLPPIDNDDDEDTLYVNAKQFSRIMKRRDARMKLEKEGRISRIRKKYLHESRHLHALSRMRGRGGKFGKRSETMLLPQKWPSIHLPQLVSFQVPQISIECPIMLKTVVEKQKLKESVKRTRRRRPRAAPKRTG